MSAASAHPKALMHISPLLSFSHRSVQHTWSLRSPWQQIVRLWHTIKACEWSLPPSVWQHWQRMYVVGLAASPVSGEHMLPERLGPYRGRVVYARSVVVHNALPSKNESRTGTYTRDLNQIIGVCVCILCFLSLCLIQDFPSLDLSLNVGP